MSITTTVFIGQTTYARAGLVGGLPYIEIYPDGRYGDAITLYLGLGSGPIAHAGSRHAITELTDAIFAAGRLLDEVIWPAAGPDDDEDNDEDATQTLVLSGDSRRVPDADGVVRPTVTEHPMTEAEMRSAYGDR